MLLPIQAPPKIRNRKLSTAKISNKMAGLMPSQFIEEGDEDEDIAGFDDFDSTDFTETFDDYNY